MNDSMPPSRCRKSTRWLPLSIKIVASGILYLFLFLAVACVQETPEKKALSPTPPKTAPVPQVQVTPTQTSPPPSVPQGPLTPSTSSQRLPSVAAEPVTSAPPGQAPTPPAPVSPNTMSKAPPPKTMNSSRQPLQTASTSPSSSVFVKPPGVPERFHMMHPINPQESCVTSRCHALKKTVQYAHAPVASGACVLCHQNVVSNPPLGLKDTGPDLCLKCHKDQKTFYNEARFVHAPVKDKCINCHNPHGSTTSKFFLNQDQFSLCLSCHINQEKNPNEIPQISIARMPHKPVIEGRCTGCHTPHASNFKKLLKDGPQETKLCFSCHKEKAAEIKNASFIHGPIREGLCTACHTPHGSDSSYLLKYYYVRTFYNPFNPELYALCFKCHKETLVLDERTTTLTNFRNGDRNLHYLHVNREKGRTCVACHEVHAGVQEKQIRSSTPFGDWSIPIQFVKTPTGGKCLVSCHVLREYDRENPVELNIDKASAKTGLQRGG
jgi:predicted CXXCH cytochrome family protein